MDLQLKGKVIVVTGGSKGIGYGICEQLIQEEAQVVIIGRNKETIPEAVNQLSAARGKVGFAYAELTDAAACKKAVQEVLDQYGAIDGLVNNAGVAILAPMIEVEEEELDYIFNVNIYGPYRITNNARGGARCPATQLTAMARTTI